ncbi:MAG: hypothetical protein ABIQ97_06115 [Lysobacteraceae bacterium]
MDMQVIDATIVSTNVKRANAKVTVYDAVVIRLADGTEQRIEKLAAAPAVATLLEPGTDGRFYVYKTIDHSGIMAVRTRDGRTAFAIPSGNETIMLMTAVVGALWFTVLLVTGKLGILALIMAIGGSYMWFRYRQTRIQGRARYDADSSFPHAVASTTE